jgi:hypothetical protein
MTLEELTKRRDDLYIKIGEARGDELDDYLDEVWKIEDQIEEIENPPTPPMTIESFESHYNVEREYERFRDEYGDAAALYSDYLQYHYNGYCVFHKSDIYFCF